jgi:hypothetical protein
VSAIPLNVTAPLQYVHQSQSRNFLGKKIEIY